MSVFHNQSGMTLVESVLTLSIMVVLFTLAAPSLWASLQQYQLQAYSQDLLQALRVAQGKAMQSEGASAYSVHVVTGSGGSFTVYRGSTYASRDTEYDEVYTLPSSLSLSSTLPDVDVTFAKTIGTTSDTGSLTVAWTGGAQAKTVTIAATGRVDRQ